jgi:hypothetical protein
MYVEYVRDERQLLSTTSTRQACDKLTWGWMGDLVTRSLPWLHELERAEENELVLFLTPH